jgi:aryl-alcohol dehydrogenase
VLNFLKPGVDSSIAVFGCGAVGMAAICAAASLGVKTIIAVDLVASRLTLAKEFGATHTVVATSPDLLTEIRAPTKHKAGVEFAVEASGNVRALKNAYDAMAPFGRLASCGDPGPGIQPPFEIHDMICSGKSYAGVLEGNGYPQEVRWSGSTIIPGLAPPPRRLMAQRPRPAVHSQAHGSPSTRQVSHREDGERVQV